MAAKNWLTTPEAVALLGVKQETLYAYVSRGIVTRRLAESGKGSEFPRAELEHLAKRRTKQNRRGGIEVVIASRISSIEGDQLFFRGIPIIDVIKSSSFEETANLVWDGIGEKWPSATATVVPGLDDCLRLPDRIRLAVAYFGATTPTTGAKNPALARNTARAIINLVARSVGPASVAGATGVASILAGPGADASTVALFDLVLQVMADHEMATSTLAARVAASTRADIPDVILAGLGALAGPLHGSAAELVHKWLVHSESVGATAAVGDMMRNGQRLPGIGHKVYRVVDPRTAPILDAVYRVASEAQIANIKALSEAAVVAVGRCVNVDFALGALTYVLGQDAELSEVLFSISRIVGWTAHALEEYEEPPLRFRARALAF